MADNTALNVGAGGDTTRSIDKAGVKAQVVVLDLGGAGAESLLTTTLPVSVATLPLPADAATQTTLALIKAKTDNLDVLLSTRTKPADTQPVSGPGALSYGSGQVNGLGNNTCITPAAGKKIRVYYLNYNPLLAVEAGFRFGATGTLILRANVIANSVIAKDCGDFRYVEGAVDEALILNLSLAVNVIWNAFYLEI